MIGVLEGFGVITVVIAVGFLLAHVGVLTLEYQELLSRLVFFVGSPALLFSVLADTDVAGALSQALVANAASVAVVAAIAISLARWRWRRGWGDATMAGLGAGYVNAGNLGLPIALYVIGDVSAVAGALLLQLLVLAPLAFVVLDQAASGERPTLWRVVSRPFRNPVTVAAVIGVVVALSGVSVPRWVADPIDLLAGLAIPGMLIAFGLSLRLGPKPGASGASGQVATISALKLLAQPLVAYLVGRFALGLDGEALLAVVVVAGLPTAQNVFVTAVRYDRAVPVIRDVVFATTVLSFGTILAIAALLA
ncbi:AEC family transporter [Mumia zhuanghuii]|uniref:AEC family transporter n=2 Tax=Mumia TaxID=1546255 RepID=A0ABW1QGJ4_9ACTN|nr:MULTISPECIES: AEC family transporter [Mumia]KAA1425253.1 AEC family transporter [Mumia zhuanghuii]